CPAPALPGTVVKVPASALARHGAAAVVVVVGAFSAVTVLVLVTVCVTVTVVVVEPPPQPATSAAHPAAMTNALTSSEFATDGREPRRATPRRRRSGAAPVRASRGRAR